MARKKREKEIPEELEIPEEEEETPKVGLRPTPTPAVDKEAQWAKIESEMATVKDDFMSGRITLDEAIDMLVASLNAIKTEAAPGLTGLEARPQMEFPEEEETTPPTV